jgi:predicted nucleotidyltransferase component of viral defense system
MADYMTLHENKEDFSALVTRTSEYLKIPEFFIEKDYWVTYLLRNLSLSKYRDSVVFKGGTSLSKAYDCIERFSEDIDLALAEPALGDAKRKTMMKDIEKTVSKGLEYLKDHPMEEKKGRNRRTFYEYPRLITNVSVSPVKDIIQLEINTFTRPSPSEKRSIKTFIHSFLEDNGYKEEIRKYGLESFEVNVLSLERTLFEKTLSLLRLSYEGSSGLRPKIRHFYDIACILNKYGLSGNAVSVLRSALDDDRSNSTFAGVWLEIPLYKAPLFENFKSIWKDLEPVYMKELSTLVWSDKLLPVKEIKASIDSLRSFIEKNQNFLSGDHL